MIASDPIHATIRSCKQGAVHIWIPATSAGMTALVLLLGHR
jgi:hypothetical protein